MKEKYPVMIEVEAFYFPEEIGVLINYDFTGTAKKYV
jgi:hypothetical protein